MKVLSQEGFLLHVDEVPETVKKGIVMENESGTTICITYVDRDENIVGFLPLEDALS